MDWSNAKTIFIITFLLLNMFLGYQLNQKSEASKLNLILEATLQERLMEMNITITTELQEEQLTGTYITGIANLSLDTIINKQKPNQQVEGVSDETVTVTLKEPFPLKQLERSIGAQAVDFVSGNIVNGQEYYFSDYNESLGQIYFYQTYHGKKVDNYESGQLPLILHLDDDLNIIQYEQNYLTLQPLDSQGNAQEIMTSIKAIEKLFNNQLIPPDSNINKLELSYYSFFKPSGEVQVFAPMWNISVNDQIYYVNAIDGAIQNIQ